MQRLPWPSNSVNFEQTVTIDGNNYVMSGLWSNRSSSWFVSLYTNNKTEDIITSRRLEVGLNLLHNAYNVNTPKGYIVVVPDGSEYTQVTKDNVGKGISLIFVREDELE